MYGHWYRLNVPPFAIGCSRDVVDIHSDRRFVGGDGRLPGISWRSVAVAFFGGDFQLRLEYRSDEALYIKGEEGEVERNQ
ncbi:hypothetical protein Bca52824_044881 [Brassica carinata]|uniref:Uncharacterized protein n=1 Tax=Brassica carinata TaxID=52824 RepID=A0A8X7RC18_BRACI|nr:hypothetical protein Bca52824_044881 [Brassica carinata]